MARRYAASFGILMATFLGGCSQTISLYHEAEGGAISEQRQPPPGADLPYPNLADVPALPSPVPPQKSASQGSLSASPQALAGLSLPAAPPPLPTISGLKLASGMGESAAPKPLAITDAKPPSTRPSGPLVTIGFRSGSALLPYSQHQLVEAVAAKRGDAQIRVCGFGDGSLHLALARARRLGDALTAAGVPGDKIHIMAFAAGSGGFVQLVY